MEQRRYSCNTADMRRCLFAIVCTFFCCAMYAQDAADNDYSNQSITGQLGISGGAMNCITDLGGKSKIFKTFKPEAGFYAGFLYHNAIGARLELTWGSVTASDANAKEAGVRQRNFSFSSDITELSLLAEIHPLNLSSSFHFPISPYLLAGVGNFSFNPTTKLNGTTILLQPLHTEGEGFAETGRPNYKLSQFMIPIGGGISYPLSSSFTVKGELIYRILNTDYLDDVSTTYIDPALFDKYLTPVQASLAKEVYYRADEVTNNATVPVGGLRGSPAKDGYYSINIKLELMLGR